MSGVWSKVAFAAFFVLLVSCGGGRKSEVPRTAGAVKSASASVGKYVRGLRFTSPAKNFTTSTESPFAVTYEDAHKGVRDSVRIFIDNEYAATLSGDSYSFEVPGMRKAGRHSLKTEAFYSGGETGISIFSFTVLPQAPARYKYKVIKKLPHDPGSYTQGLFFHNGFLYEGTGRNGHSVLRVNNIETGKALHEISLENELFGEGIALANGKIYQLTWMNRRCLVYDAETLERRGEFSYDTEGWGLAAIGDKLVMSDGSNVLYFINPDNFSVAGRIEVYDNNGAVHDLNELEFADGLVWANVWRSDRVVAIDPETGAVVGEIDFSDIVTAGERAHFGSIENVFNGIAYNPDDGSFYVTGKCWNLLFNIQIVR